MNKGTIILTLFTMIAVASLLMIITSVNAEVLGTNHVIELEDGIVITSSLTTEITNTSGCILDWCPSRDAIAVKNEHKVQLGDIVTSEDGSMCWKVTEKIGVYYYSILKECPNGF